MQPTVRKIDFFGGLHGNFLELVVNHWIDQNSYDICQPQFNHVGACHLKNINPNYRPITRSNHYSHNQIPFDKNDLVIRIVPSQEDLLIAVINSFLRAGDQLLDIDNLEINTYQKMKSLDKLKNFLNTLIRDHGRSDHYSRKILRKYFYSMFEDHNNGLALFIDWLPVDNFYNFKFDSFFAIDKFLQSLQEISKFVNLEFKPDQYLIKFHEEFLQHNQGYASKVKCCCVIDSIINQRTMPLKLNIIEEAWINYKISKIFNLYDIPILEDDNYPIDTKIIANTCFAQESTC